MAGSTAGNETVLRGTIDNQAERSVVVPHDRERRLRAARQWPRRGCGTRRDRRSPAGSPRRRHAGLARRAARRGRSIFEFRVVIFTTKDTKENPNTFVLSVLCG